MQITLQPLWRRVSTDPRARCEDGDAWDLLKQRIIDQIADTAQNFINGKLVDPANDAMEAIRIPGLGDIKNFFGGSGDFFEDVGDFFVEDVGGFFQDPIGSIGSWFGRRLYHDERPVHPDSILGRPIPRVCFENSWQPYKCLHFDLTPEQARRFAQCEDARYGLENMCYFARVQEICMHDQKLNEYIDLFAQGYKTVDVVQKEFAEAFGDSFEYIDPTMAELMRQVEISSFSGPDLTHRRDICSGLSFTSAMSLEKIIQSCAFAVMESFCPKDAEADESFEFFVDTVEFELPRVRFDYEVRYVAFLTPSHPCPAQNHCLRKVGILAGDLTVVSTPCSVPLTAWVSNTPSLIVDPPIFFSGPLSHLTICLPIVFHSQSSASAACHS